MATITNSLNTPSRARRVGRRVLRGIGRTLVAVAGLIAVLALAGASYEAIAAAGDARRYPAPGQLVDVGGYRLHIQCVGTGSPTVVLDAGLGGSSLDWISSSRSLAAPPASVPTTAPAWAGASQARIRAPHARLPTSCTRC